MKKTLAVLLSMMMVLGLVACGNSAPETGTEALAETEAPETKEEPPAEETETEPSGDGMLLGVFMPSADHGFTAESIEQAIGALDEVKASRDDFDYVLYNTEEASEQTNQIATALDMYEFDAVMLWPIDGAPLYNAAQSILDAGVTLVVYDRLIPDFEPTAEMCGDNTAIGENTANYMNEYFADKLEAGETVSILEFQGDTSEATAERTNSFMATKDEGIEVVQSFVTNWSRETAFNDMTNWLANSSKEDIEKISALYIHDDEPLLGILDAIAQYDGPATVNIRVGSGVGAQKDVLDTMQPTLDEYGISVVTNTFAPGMIRQCVDLTVGIMDNSGETGLHYVPVQTITLENADEYRQSDEYKYRYPEG